MRHEKLAETISLSPALERLHAVLGLDRAPVVPAEAVAQGEDVLHAVWRHAPLLDHLRLDPMLLVRAEEGVVHEIAVIARDVAGRPHGIQDLQVGLRREPEGASTPLGVEGGHSERQRWRSGGDASEDLSTTDGVHTRDPWEARTPPERS